MLRRTTLLLFIILLSRWFAMAGVTTDSLLAEEALKLRNNFEAGYKEKNATAMLQALYDIAQLSGLNDTSFNKGKFFEKAGPLVYETGNMCLIKQFLHNKALSEFYRYNYYDAIYYALQADSVICDSAWVDYQLNSLFHLSYFALQDYNRSLAYTKKNIYLAGEKLTDTSLLCGQYNELGFTYIQMGRPDSAEYFLSVAITYGRGRDAARGYYLAALDNYAEALFMQKKYDSALIYFEQTYLLRHQNHDHWGEGNTLKNIARVYAELHDYEKAENYLERARGLAHIAENTNMHYAGFLWRDIYLTAFIIDTARANYNQAVTNYLEYVALKEKINNQEIRKKIEELEKLYQSGMQEKKIEQQKSLIQKKRAQFKYTVTVSVAVLFIMGVVMYFMQQIRKRREVLLKLQAQTLKQQLELKNKELVCNVRSIYVKNQVINKVARKLSQNIGKAKTDNTTTINSIINELKQSLDDTGWKEFETRFSQVHESFYENLQKQFPDLTENDRKLAAMLKLGLSSKEIASITMTLPESVDTARSRLRKKLGLSSDVGLGEFLNRV